MSLTQTQLVTRLMQEVKGLDNYLVDDDYNNACTDAANEFGTSYPVSGQDIEFWVKRRAKRHLFFYLMSESAHKFKFEQINLQHRFDHYSKLIQAEDTAFEKFMEDRPDLFAGVDTFKLFTTKVDAGFSYDSFGRDTTYDDIDDNEVDFTPKETD